MQLKHHDQHTAWCHSCSAGAQAAASGGGGGPAAELRGVGHRRAGARLSPASASHATAKPPGQRGKAHLRGASLPQKGAVQGALAGPLHTRRTNLRTVRGAVVRAKQRSGRHCASACVCRERSGLPQPLRLSGRLACDCLPRPGGAPVLA